jgi:hypothetical protein
MPEGRIAAGGLDPRAHHGALIARSATSVNQRQPLPCGQGPVEIGSLIGTCAGRRRRQGDLVRMPLSPELAHPTECGLRRDRNASGANAGRTHRADETRVVRIGVLFPRNHNATFVNADPSASHPRGTAHHDCNRDVTLRNLKSCRPHFAIGVCRA